MNKLSKYPLFLLFTALASCSSDDDAMPASHPVAPPRGDALAVTITARDFVTDGAPDTRATGKETETTFENDDRVGIIILDNKDRPLYNNIPYKYVSSSSTWEFDSNNDEGKEICYYDSKARTYIVYYPYNKDADNCKSESELKAIFKPKTDQRDKKDYRASDLMVNTIISDVPLPSLTAELKHVYASISLALTTTGAKYVLEGDVAYTGNYKPNDADISNVNLTVGDDIYFLHQAADGTWRCILPAGTGVSEPVRCFYTIGSKTYGNTIGIGGSTVANTRYTSSPEIKDVTYSLGNAHVGDYYCVNDKKEGYLIPGDVTPLSPDQQTACIGIVYCTDINRIGDAAKKVLKDKGVTTPRGLVMALTETERYRWGDIVDENGDGGTGTFQNNTSTLKKQYNNVDGYAETHWILDTYRNGDALEKTYSAFYHASRYGTDSGTAKYTAPNTTTGWFIPSMGQWWDILSNLGEIDLKKYQGSEEFKILIPELGQTAVDNMNKYITGISGATWFSTGSSMYYWSSSEYSSNFACCVGFSTGYYLQLQYLEKDLGFMGRVRCVFAF